MGNAIAPGNAIAQGLAQDLPSYLHDLPSCVYESTIGTGKVLKSLKCLVDGGHVVVRIFIKQYPDLKLVKYVELAKKLRAMFDLKLQPSVLPPSIVEEHDKAAFMVRQYFASSLYDRFHTHPFLLPIEKKWLAFQLLTALKQMHALGVRHGDIKSENVLLTSWNWLLLADVAFYKPTFLPADNPHHYGFFFETGSRRRCYLAPERFQHSQLKEDDEAWCAPVTEAMDIFSAGCVIAELFLEGEHRMFDLSQLLSFREGKYDPAVIINKISDPEARRLVQHMTNRDPTQRLSATQYLAEWATSDFFPPYFDRLYGSLAELLSPENADPDSKLLHIWQCREEIIQTTVMRPSVSGAPREAWTLDQSPASPTIVAEDLEVDKQSQAGTGSNFVKELDAFSAALVSRPSELPRVPEPAVQVSVQSARSSWPMSEAEADGQGLTMVVSAVCSCIQNVRYPTNKLTSLELLQTFAEHVDDQVNTPIVLCTLTTQTILQS
jgi:phosphoinositide-3-kinase regulatory subunit 4